MTNTETQPLPCPCCNHPVSCKPGFRNGYGTYYFIHCDCGLLLNGQFEADVIQRWNRRDYPQQDSQPALDK